MSENEKFSLATQIFVRLRRNSGRMIDVIWMATNAEYAAEILRIARETGDHDLSQVADRFEAALNGTGRAASAPARSQSDRETPDEVKAHYIGTLR